MPVPYDRNISYEPLYVLLAVIMMCCLNIAGPLFITPAMQKIGQDVALQEFETAFGALQHPGQTALISQKTAAGYLSNSQTGCDFFVGELRSYQGDQDKIRAAYTGQTVKNVDKIPVVFVENGLIQLESGQSFPELIKRLESWTPSQEQGEQPLYIVYIFVTGYQGYSNLDCR